MTLYGKSLQQTIHPKEIDKTLAHFNKYCLSIQLSNPVCFRLKKIYISTKTGFITNFKSMYIRLQSTIIADINNRIYYSSTKSRGLITMVKCLQIPRDEFLLWRKDERVIWRLEKQIWAVLDSYRCRDCSSGGLEILRCIGLLQYNELLSRIQMLSTYNEPRNQWRDVYTTSRINERNFSGLLVLYILEHWWTISYVLLTTIP